MTEQLITELIGKPFEIDWRKPKAIGSAGFYLKSFNPKSLEIEILKLNSKCSFEKRTRGILLRANYSNKLTEIPIPKENIIGITLIRGKENINPFFLSPMWILLKLGVSKLYARYFRFRLNEYSIDQMGLNLNTTEYEMNFIANGYLFERQLSFFENLNYGNKLKKEIKANT
ncbi:hypothetical protein D2V93_11825 [Flagellimonas taeanensis]|uniref:hypothetical protein n=1 Tax=Flavobacteriaceae TaxID=49546 RepID=UPI000E68B6F0|nr:MULTISPECIES: hypothetical protein [Allomuricauda]MDC6386707.1 hypothetical protein [Muricauda sp. SK9]RIV49991.1 hypothetical protein D2V93_11825 [Allomuricauda taeanensis]